MSGTLTRALALVVGLSTLGAGIAFMARADLGLPVWSVLHDGVSRRIGVPLGTADILVGILVFAAWFPLRVRPGLGTLVSVFLVGIATNVGLAVLPPFDGLGTRLAALALGVTLGGCGAGAYLAAGLGPGARDGIMTGLHRRFGWSVWRVRVCIDVVVLVAGAALGGAVGVGTIVAALATGPLVDLVLRVLDREGRVRVRVEPYVSVPER